MKLRMQEEEAGQIIQRIICTPGPRGGPCRRHISATPALSRFMLLQMVVCTRTTTLAMVMESVRVSRTH